MMIRGILLTGLLLLPWATAAASKRVYVYPVSQQYWDVRPGETLGGIAEALLPGSTQHRQRLMDDILRLNPGAFIDQDPNRLLAYARLWLPNTVTRPVSAAQDNEIREFDWGYIKKIQ
ncbi:MAG TPA: hypothetical protein VFX02_09320 [Gammaproteobacteria bacterium]|nr:hypothetical protein [Gammaproteobacteria bacterium]